MAYRSLRRPLERCLELKSTIRAMESGVTGMQMLTEVVSVMTSSREHVWHQNS